MKISKEVRENMTQSRETALGGKKDMCSPEVGRKVAET